MVNNPRTFGENLDIVNVDDVGSEFIVVTDKVSSEKNLSPEVLSRYLGRTIFSLLTYDTTYTNNTYDINTSAFTINDVLNEGVIVQCIINDKVQAPNPSLSINGLGARSIKTLSGYPISKNGLYSGVAKFKYSTNDDAFIYLSGSGEVGAYIQTASSTTPFGCVALDGSDSIVNYPELASVITSLPDVRNLHLRTQGDLLGLNELQQDAIQRITGTWPSTPRCSTRTPGSSYTTYGTGLFSNMSMSYSSFNAVDPTPEKGGSVRISGRVDSADVVRSADETRVKSIGVSTFLRVV